MNINDIEKKPHFHFGIFIHFNVDIYTDYVVVAILTVRIFKKKFVTNTNNHLSFVTVVLENHAVL